MQPRLASRRVAVLSALVLVTGCGSSSSADDVRDRLDAWRGKAPSRYRWTLVVTEPLFGSRSITVRVVDGDAVEAYAGKERLAIVDGEADGLPATVDALIEHLIELAPDAGALDVEWAAEGYPSEIRLDVSDAIDDEVSYAVESFEPLGGR